MSAHYVIFRGRPSIRGRWRFRLVASNGEVVGPASQGFDSPSKAERGVLAHAAAALEAAGVRRTDLDAILITQE